MKKKGPSGGVAPVLMCHLHPPPLPATGFSNTMTEESPINVQISLLSLVNSSVSLRNAQVNFYKGNYGRITFYSNVA